MSYMNYKISNMPKWSPERHRSALVDEVGKVCATSLTRTKNVVNLPTVGLPNVRWVIGGVDTESDKGRG